MRARRTVFPAFLAIVSVLAVTAPVQATAIRGELAELKIVGGGSGGYTDCHQFTNISATVKNSGHVDAGTFSIRFDIDHRHQLGMTKVPSLAAGAEISTEPFDRYNPNPEEGPVTFWVTVDWENLVPEKDETNNRMSLGTLWCYPPRGYPS